MIVASVNLVINEQGHFMLRILRYQLLFVVLILPPLLLTGCGQSSVENEILGTWDVSVFWSNEDFVKFSKEPMPDGVEMEMTAKGTVVYHRGGKYNAEGKMTIRLRTPEGEISFRFYTKEAGEWELHASGKQIVETTVDSTFTPLDELSKSFLEESPEMAASMKPVKGESTTSKILSISDSVMQIQLQEEPYLKLTLNRQ